MPLKLLLIFLSVLTLHAAAPRVYSTVGDPVYAAVAPVKTLSVQKAFRQDADLFSTFVREAKRAEKEGYWLEKYRMLPEAKKRSVAYLETLRRLERVNGQIAMIVKKTTLDAIKKHRTRTYYAIKKSAHPVLRQDRDLRRAMAGFERRLARETRRKRERRAEREAAYFRTAKHLRGTWEGVSKNGQRIRYRFQGASDVTIIRSSQRQTRTLQGRWKIDGDTMTIALHTITNRKNGGIPHTRDTSVTLTEQIRSIGKKTMVLFDVRRKEEIALTR